jgi:hypothetical protein
MVAEISIQSVILLSGLRICKDCQRRLPISSFYQIKSGFYTPEKPGVRHRCKECDLKYCKQYRKTHRKAARKKERVYERTFPRKRWSIACLSGHRRRGYAVQLTPKELYEIASKTESCFICGCQLNWQLGNKGHMLNVSPTLDRIDNEDVITKDNILILCYKCNATKRDRTFAEFVTYCTNVSKKFYSHLEYPQLVHL